jgi:Bacteriophage tail sheath protein
MATAIKTPGVYIKEINAFPNSVVEVPTAVPAFIGYTEKIPPGPNTPTRISSMAEYIAFFGGPPDTQFTFNSADSIAVVPKTQFLLYYSMRLFFDNGGGPCWIVSIGNYADAITAGKSKDDFTDPLPELEKELEPTMLVAPDAALLSENDWQAVCQQFLAHCGKMQSRISILDVFNGSAARTYKDDDVVSRFRDRITSDFLNYGQAYYPWVNSSIVDDSEVDYSAITPSSLVTLTKTLTDAIAAVPEPAKTALSTLIGRMPTALAAAIAKPARDAQDAQTAADRAAEDATTPVTDAIKAARKTADDKTAADRATADSQTATGWITAARATADAQTKTAQAAADAKAPPTPEVVAARQAAATQLTKDRAAEDAAAAARLAQDVKPAAPGSPVPPTLTQIHRSLVAVSTTYVKVMANLQQQLNLLPPSGGMAGVYTRVDNSIGVFKAPANTGINSVVSPAVNITDADQEDLNVPLDGKAVNAIRTFPGRGLLVWGARTLDGNSQDWRYINVRRTIIMLEQSIKYACLAYVFEPNNAGTWVTVRNMISNFLTNQWKSGALVGAKPEEAYSVDIGLGSTMTADDILDGFMNVTVKVALVRPAEFIVITFQQKMQTS